MADTTEADSTTTNTQEETSEGGKDQTKPTPPTNGEAKEASNGLTAQLEEKIIRQVEYYFGDRNLPRDKFLQSAAAESEGGWVPVTTLLTFNRLKALSSDSDCIVRALRKSTANILEVNAEGTSVRRCPDNPPPDIFSPEQRQKMKEKTVYVKGFEETEKLDDIQSFLDKYGKLEHVQMRRKTTDKTFKGSVFAEFKEKEVAESFLGLPTIEFKGKELIKESKEAYFQRKAEDRRREKEEKREATEAAAAKAAREAAVSKAVQTKGAVLFFKGPFPPDTTREKIKEEMQEYATVAFIDFSKGDTEGNVRFSEEGGATKGLEGLTTAAGEGEKPKMCGTEVELRVLNEEEEVDYWVKAQEGMSKGKSRGGRGGGRGGRRGGGRGGRQGDGRKRKQRSRDGEGPVAKQSKPDEGEEGAGTMEEETEA